MNNADIKRPPVWEGTLFMWGITFVGGYLNAYTFVTRSGVLSNMHTGNMSKLGINLAIGDWSGAWTALLPILMCILGAVFSEWMKKRHGKSKPGGVFSGDWRKLALTFELVFLFCLGLVPQSAPDLIVTAGCSFITGFQLSLFRTWLGKVHNTTICTGNLRGLGETLFATLNHPGRKTFRKLLANVSVVFAFTLGGIVGTWLSQLLGVFSVWVCCALLLAGIVFMRVSEAKSNAVSCEAA